ncbi:MAG: acyl-CoA dehydrogenase, partial [Flavobacteriales bacterium]|nr:acyl-CoA dehydrogenase [Flavobacteriales bacterium]
MHIADMVIDTYLTESVVLRTEKLAAMKGAEAVKEQLAMCNVFVRDAADRVHKHAKEAINAFAEGDEQRAMLMGAKRFTKCQPFNSKEARRTVARKMIAEGKCSF